MFPTSKSSDPDDTVRGPAVVSESAALLNGGGRRGIGGKHIDGEEERRAAIRPTSIVLTSVVEHPIVHSTAALAATSSLSTVYDGA